MEYTLIRSSRRSLGLQIRLDGSLVVRAPRLMKKKTIDEMVESHREWIESHRASALAHRAAHPEPTEEQLALWRSEARELLPQRVAYYSELMGLAPTRITITAARTRFGSCSGKNSLSFSCRLMDYPMEAIDYVVVHELSHIRHHNHGKDFYRLIESVLPDWRQREALLRR